MPAALGRWPQAVALTPWFECHTSICVLVFFHMPIEIPDVILQVVRRIEAQESFPSVGQRLQDSLQAMAVLLQNRRTL